MGLLMKSVFAKQEPTYSDLRTVLYVHNEDRETRAK